MKTRFFYILRLLRKSKESNAKHFYVKYDNPKTISFPVTLHSLKEKQFTNPVET